MYIDIKAPRNKRKKECTKISELYACWWRIYGSKADFIFGISPCKFLPAHWAAFPFANLLWFLGLGPIIVCWQNDQPSIPRARLISRTNFATICRVQGWFETCLVFVRLRTASKAVKLSVPFFLRLGKIFLVLFPNVTFPECFWSQLEISLRFNVSFCVYDVNKGHSAKNRFGLKCRFRGHFRIFFSTLLELANLNFLFSISYCSELHAFDWSALVLKNKLVVRCITD